MGKIIRDICDIYEKIRVIRAHHPCHSWFQKSPISSGLFAHPFKMDKMDNQMDKLLFARFMRIHYLCAQITNDKQQNKLKIRDHP